MPQKNNTAVQKAYSQIRKDILEGVLRQGYPIIEERYSERLEISRTPVREAIRKIESEGLIKTIPRKGSFVRTYKKEEIKEIYELSESLEGMAAYLVAENISKEEKEALRKAIVEMQEALNNEDISRWLEADTEFHTYLIDFCKNKQLTRLARQLNEQIAVIRIFTIQNAVVNKQKSTTDHADVCEAIIQGDADKARILMQKHVRRIRETLLKYL